MRIWAAVLAVTLAAVGVGFTAVKVPYDYFWYVRMLLVPLGGIAICGGVIIWIAVAKHRRPLIEGKPDFSVAARVGLVCVGLLLTAPFFVALGWMLSPW